MPTPVSTGSGGSWRSPIDLDALLRATSEYLIAVTPAGLPAATVLPPRRRALWYGVLLSLCGDECRAGPLRVVLLLPAAPGVTACTFRSTRARATRTLPPAPSPSSLEGETA
ncbi:hypothetical protein [Streptomyces sp. NPDC005131]